jgi:hypothetical protein
VCVERGDSGAAYTPINAAAGTSCATRRDCAGGLACISNICQTMTLGVAEVSSRFSGRGESCRAKNDCAPPLACVDETCQMVNIALGHTKKSCHRVECAAKADCCAGFVPNAKCDVYKENCNTDPIFCNTYRSLCECAKDCVDELCVDEPPGCKSADECTSAQTPFCLEGKCSACDKDSACQGADSRCVMGQCIAACMFDEQCPMLQRCQEGVCKETGCTTQRECAFLTKNSLAICREGKCQVPCEVDTDCDGAGRMGLGFEVCEQGQCTFVGCENNAECRALLDIESDDGLARAICR